MKKIMGQVHIDIRLKEDREYFKYRLISGMAISNCPGCGGSIDYGSFVMHVGNKYELMIYCPKCKTVYFPLAIYQNYHNEPVIKHLFSADDVETVQNEQDRLSGLTVPECIQLVPNETKMVLVDIDRFKLPVDKYGNVLASNSYGMIGSVKIPLWINKVTNEIFIATKQFEKHADKLLECIDDSSLPLAVRIIRIIENRQKKEIEELRQKKIAESNRQKKEITELVQKEINASKYQGDKPLGTRPKQRKRGFFS